jgi:hypothetical protein
MNSCNISIALHISSIRLWVTMVAVQRVLVGVETVRGVEGDTSSRLLLVHLLGEAVDNK